jgi:hypothetical protein
MARVLILQGHPKEAIEQLDGFRGRERWVD